MSRDNWILKQRNADWHKPMGENQTRKVDDSLEMGLHSYINMNFPRAASDRTVYSFFKSHAAGYIWERSEEKDTTRHRMS